MSLAAVLGPLGVPELLIIAFIVILVFGVGRLPEVGGALGKGIREFRKSTKDLDDDDRPAALDTAAAGASASAAATMQTSAPPPSAAQASDASGDSRFCSECGARNTRVAKFCAECGHSMSVTAG
jgi:sec-independent protein translocase protein TatA